MYDSLESMSRMNVSGVRLVCRAVNFAARAHQDQRRKDEQAAPYINHSIEVMHLIAQHVDLESIDNAHEILCAAVLHDVVEDTDVTLQEIKDEFGDVVAGLVREVSDDKSVRKGERKRLQWHRLKRKSIGAQLIKLADKCSNCGDLHKSRPNSWTDCQVHAYLLWSRAMILSLKPDIVIEQLRAEALRTTYMDGMPEFTSNENLNTFVENWLYELDYSGKEE